MKQVHTVGLDITKLAFQVHGATASGVHLGKALSKTADRNTELDATREPTLGSRQSSASNWSPQSFPFCCFLQRAGFGSAWQWEGIVQDGRHSITWSKRGPKKKGIA
jgi:hypothetical protein